MKKNKSVIYWLLSGCVLLFIMVTVGGITRLTNSGFIYDRLAFGYRYFSSLTEEKWDEAFEEYKKFPEYQKVNQYKDFQLDDYKFIFFWEWFHRFIGRIIGVVFIIPFVYFLIKKKLDNETIQKMFYSIRNGRFSRIFGLVHGKKRFDRQPRCEPF